MANLDRRGFVQTAAAAASGFAPAPATRAAVPSRLSDIDHIIVLMKENRSFDHYFGSLRGARGFDDPRALQMEDGRSVFHQPDPDHPDGYVLPFRLDTTRTAAQHLHELSHNWDPQHAAWNGGAMDRWLTTHRAIELGLAPLTMGYHTREDLPFYYALADAFTICDGYYCSVFGPTHPNRIFLMTGTIDPAGLGGGPVLDNKRRTYTFETYPERLQRAGITWRIYHDVDDFGCNVCRHFERYQTAAPGSPLHDGAMRNRTFASLLDDLRRGDIPQVTWIVPHSFATEHPSFMPAAGEDHTHQILRALWDNPRLWARTALVLNYDENDGQFDHVAPPTPPPGTPGEFVNGLPTGLGFRVPCLVISPFSRGGFVCGQTFDHSSVLRLIEARFGVEIPSLSRWRREASGDLTAAFGFGAPPDLTVPVLPDTAIALVRAEANVALLPAPTMPARQVMPKQEPGTRPRRT